MMGVSHFVDLGDQCLYARGNYGNCTVQKLARGSLVGTPLSYMSTVHFPTGFHKAINATQVVGPCMYIQCPQYAYISPLYLILFLFQAALMHCTSLC